MFVINWKWKEGALAYVTKRQPNCKPYTSNINDPDIKTWTTENRAKLWLSRKDKQWASNCEIIPLTNANH